MMIVWYILGIAAGVARYEGIKNVFYKDAIHMFVAGLFVAALVGSGSRRKWWLLLASVLTLFEIYCFATGK